MSAAWESSVLGRVTIEPRDLAEDAPADLGPLSCRSSRKGWVGAG